MSPPRAPHFNHDTASPHSSPPKFFDTLSSVPPPPPSPPLPLSVVRHYLAPQQPPPEAQVPGFQYLLRKLVKEVRKQYIYEMELPQIEKQRKDEARIEALRVANEERKKLKVEAVQIRAQERKIAQQEFRETLVDICAQYCVRADKVFDLIQIQEPIVCGITSLEYDHMEILGNTLGEIAGEKAGIFKDQISAFTVPQPDEAMRVLEEKASQLNVPLQVVNPLDPSLLNGLRLGLEGEHQYLNAGLAVALCSTWLKRTGHLGDTNLEKSVLDMAKKDWPS
ncbi:hypothetical protein Ahy_B02g060410 [Arachis hypogaea]|uniref:Uncharacterized protein n=1 Tax=Arachis hypogaea TaxID=3818 RepID=A0A445AII1_ARAHY|nr:hypothetical protein Ahy_B02g060410 [Arachis hypogaea]